MLSDAVSKRAGDALADTLHIRCRLRHPSQDKDPRRPNSKAAGFSKPSGKPMVGQGGRGRGRKGFGDGFVFGLVCLVGMNEIYCCLHNVDVSTSRQEP
jgi:hypothetical protein